MREILYSNRFKQDIKRARKRQLNLSKLQNIIDLLASDHPLPIKCRPHKLSGNYAGYWECHIEPDWLLIYSLDLGTLDLAATGTHSDLFK